MLLHFPAEPRYPPIIDRKLSPQEVIVGDSIELECHITGSAPMKVTWSKDHKDIRTGGNYKISFVENTPHLTILKADKGDTGKYFCHASNDMGKDSCSADITVKGISNWVFLALLLEKHSGPPDDVSLRKVILLFVPLLLCFFGFRAKKPSNVHQKTLRAHRRHRGQTGEN